MNARGPVSRDEAGPFKDFLLKACGFCFENGREESLLAGLAQRMTRLGSGAAGDYLRLLAQDQDELRCLVELLTVNETYFFRELEHLRLLAEVLLPEMLALGPHGPLSLLSAGCASGEEPYSLAMLLYDRYGPACARMFRLTGVDIDENVLAGARRGVYGRHSFRGADQGLVARHFEAQAGEMRLKEEIRNLVGFAPVNLLAPQYPPVMRGLDAILYRNVSIYFPKPVQKKVFSRLGECLNPGGYLLVGAAETLPHDLGFLSLVERNSLYVYRKDPKAGNARTPMSAPVRFQAPAARPKPKVGLPNEHKPPARPAPAQDEDLVDQALALAQAGRLDAALGLLDRRLRQEPKDASAACLRASVLMSARRLDEAREACRLALALDPKRPEPNLMLAVAACQEQADEAAVRLLRQAIYLDASCWLAHFHLAELMYGLGEKKRARAGYETALKLLSSGAATGGVFPLAFNAGQYQAMCRHKLALLK